ncbi:fluoride efflux transporter FluC [Cellulomonas sp. P5_E12]
MTRPAHLDPRLVAVVAVGGAVGTTARWALTQAVGTSSSGWPTATFVENLLGSFLLGALLEALLRRGSESPRGRLVRLGAGTGVLGGFTTFSSLAIEMERLIAGGQVTMSLLYGALSVVLGLLACIAGIALAARHHHWRQAR